MVSAILRQKTAARHAIELDIDEALEEGCRGRNVIQEHLDLPSVSRRTCERLPSAQSIHAVEQDQLSSLVD